MVMHGGFRAKDATLSYRRVEGEFLRAEGVSESYCRYMFALVDGA